MSIREPVKSERVEKVSSYDTDIQAPIPNEINTSPVRQAVDWNSLEEYPKERQRDLTSNIEVQQHTTKTVDNSIVLHKTLKKIIEKKKTSLPNAKSFKKIVPVPNLNMARNKAKNTDKDAVTASTSTSTATTQPVEISKRHKIEDLLLENTALREEIQQLIKLLEGDKDKQESIANIPTKNRFDALIDISQRNPPQEDGMNYQEEMVYQEEIPSTEFLTYLKRKNTQQETIKNKKKLNYVPKDEAETRHKSNQSTSQDQQPAIQKARRKDRPPPINILYQDPKDTTRLLKANISNMNNFYIKRINNGKHVLQINNMDNFKTAKELLIKCNSRFYTYTSKLEKPITILLKGLNSSYSEKEVLDELKSLNITNVDFLKVMRFTTTKSKQDKKVLPIFIIQISPQSELNNVKKVKYLFHQVIYWEKVIRREAIQCKKCQRIGHTATNCNLPYRCVKCDTKHDPGKCSYPPQAQLEKTQLFCVNCNKHGHPASYRGCPKIIENKKKLNMHRKDSIKRTENKTTPRINNSLIQPGVKYSDVTRNSAHMNINNEINRETNNNYNNNITEAISEMKNNLSRLERIVESNSVRINSIATLLENLLHNHE